MAEIYIYELHLPQISTDAVFLIYSQYYWVDEKGKKTKYPASGYIDFVMTFVHKLITDESVFPTKYGKMFGSRYYLRPNYLDA